MATRTKASTKSVSGIQQRDDADRVIPESRRADGTVRKERKVRPGYTPPEDVAKYTNRVLEAARPVPVPAAPVSTVSDNATKTKTQIKNEKRRAKRKEEGSQPSESAGSSSTEPVNKDNDKVEGGDDGSKPLSTDPVDPKLTTTATTTTTTETTAEVTPVDREKKLRGLNKKLRQAEQLKERQDKGEEMLPEQLEKISKITDLLAQIAELSL
jgi:partner of Y14 and mago protein